MGYLGGERNQCKDPGAECNLACSDPRNTRGDWMMSGVNDGGIIGIVSKIN